MSNIENIEKSYVNWLLNPSDTHLERMKTSVLNYHYYGSNKVLEKDFEFVLQGAKRGVIEYINSLIAEDGRRKGYDAGYQEAKMDFRFPRGGMG